MQKSYSRWQYTQKKNLLFVLGHSKYLRDMNVTQKHKKLPASKELYVLGKSA